MFQIDNRKCSKRNADRDASGKCGGCGKSAWDFIGLSTENENSGTVLKRCTACYSVRYCSVVCQKLHRKEHKNKCDETANKRRAFNNALLEMELSSDIPPPPKRQDCDL